MADNIRGYVDAEFEKGHQWTNEVCENKEASPSDNFMIDPKFRSFLLKK